MLFQERDTLDKPSGAQIEMGLRLNSMYTDCREALAIVLAKAGQVIEFDPSELPSSWKNQTSKLQARKPEVDFVVGEFPR